MRRASFFVEGTCEACLFFPDAALFEASCRAFSAAGTSVDPSTKQVTIDATRLGAEVVSGTFEVEYVFSVDGGIATEVNISGAVSVMGEKLILDLGGQLPLGTPLGLRVVVLSLFDQCGDTQKFNPLMSLNDMNTLQFLPPGTQTDGGTEGGADATSPDGGGSWTVGCAPKGP